MTNVQQLLDQVNASTPADQQWKIVGNGTPIEETAPVSVPANAAAGTPASTENRGTGRYYVTIQDNAGHQRAMPLKAEPGAIKGGLVVPQTGVNDTVPDLTPDKNGKVDPTARKPNPSLYDGDLKNISWVSGGPITDVPAGTKQPSASDQLDRIGPDGNVIAPGDTTTKPIEVRDPKTGTSFPVPATAQGTIHDVGNEVWLIKPDGTKDVVGSIPEKPTTTTVPGVGLVSIDPTKPEGQRATIEMGIPAPNDPKTTQVNGITYQYDPDSKNWYQTDLPKQQQDIGYTYNDPNSDQIIFYDKQGQEVSRTTKPNWKPPVNVQPGQAPAPDAVNPFVPTVNPQTGALTFVPNQNQQKSSDATAALAKQLGVQVAAGSMSEKQAQDIITGAVNTMNAHTQQVTAQAAATNAAANATTAATGQQTQIQSAANDVLTNTSKNATTAAGMLQQRAQTAGSMLENILGQVTGNKNFGIAGNVAPGLGQQLTQGIAGYTADLMGGQGVMDTAARLVQQADPKSPLSDPTQQTAVGVLAQMLQKYQDLTGGLHPAVAATNAADASGAAGGVTAPAMAGAATGAGAAQGQTAPAAARAAAVPGGGGFQSPFYGGLSQGTGGVAASPYAGLAQGSGAAGMTDPYAAMAQPNLGGIGGGMAGFMAPKTSPTIVINAGGG